MNIALNISEIPNSISVIDSNILIEIDENYLKKGAIEKIWIILYIKPITVKDPLYGRTESNRINIRLNSQISNFNLSSIKSLENMMLHFDKTENLGAISNEIFVRIENIWFGTLNNGQIPLSMNCLFYTDRALSKTFEVKANSTISDLIITIHKNRMTNKKRMLELIDPSIYDIGKIYSRPKSNGYSVDYNQYKVPIIKIPEHNKVR